jgi:hypothetical protein
MPCDSPLCVVVQEFLRGPLMAKTLPAVVSLLLLGFSSLVLAANLQSEKEEILREWLRKEISHSENEIRNSASILEELADALKLADGMRHSNMVRLLIPDVAAVVVGAGLLREMPKRISPFGRVLALILGTGTLSAGTLDGAYRIYLITRPEYELVKKKLEDLKRQIDERGLFVQKAKDALRYLDD